MYIQKIKSIAERFFKPIISIVLICLLVLYRQLDDSDKNMIEKPVYTKKFIVIDRRPSSEMLFMRIGTNQKEKELPKSLRYTNINKDYLKRFLTDKNSILVDEPYFSTIISVAETFDIHPLLMFAILGQEQGFVPRDNKYATAIANNPFNVFGSWRQYNTDIEDSSQIAARTLINLSTNRPSGEDPIKWINTRGGQGGYATDENWWVGVKSIFEILKEETN